MSLLNRLDMFQAILDEGNMTAAAEKLYVSQPYLSKLLKQTEDEVGTPLFERLPREMRITMAGERYYVYLKRLESLEMDMSADIEMIAQHKKGKIKLGINPALGTALLPKILPEFMEQYPDIDIELYEQNALDVELALENNIIDIALGMMPIQNKALAYEYIYEDEMYILISKQNPLYDPNIKEIKPFPFKLSVLDRMPLVVLPPNYGLGRIVEDFYQKNRLRQNVILTTNTVYTAIGLVRKGIGSTFIPVTGMSWVNFSDCNVYSFDNDVLKSNYVIYYRKERFVSPYMRAFIDIATKNLTEESKSFFIKT